MDSGRVVAIAKGVRSVLCGIAWRLDFAFLRLELRIAYMIRWKGWGGVVYIV
jgi:hypothetical protein